MALQLQQLSVILAQTRNQCCRRGRLAIAGQAPLVLLFLFASHAFAYRVSVDEVVEEDAESIDLGLVQPTDSDSFQQVDPRGMAIVLENDVGRPISEVVLTHKWVSNARSDYETQFGIYKAMSPWQGPRTYDKWFRPGEHGITLNTWDQVTACVSQCVRRGVKKGSFVLSVNGVRGVKDALETQRTASKKGSKYKIEFAPRAREERKFRAGVDHGMTISPKGIVVAVSHGSPSFEQGVTPSWRLIKIDGRRCTGTCGQLEETDPYFQGVCALHPKGPEAKQSISEEYVLTFDVMHYKNNVVQDETHYTSKSNNSRIPEQGLFYTRIGIGGGQDWWQMIVRFRRLNTEQRQKYGQESECLVCRKEDNTCETIVSEPSVKAIQVFTDPLSFFKLGVGAAVFTVTALATGPIAPIAAALGGSAMNGVAENLVDGSDTSLMQICQLEDIDLVNWQRNEIPARVHIYPGSDESNPANAELVLFKAPANEKEVLLARLGHKSMARKVCPIVLNAIKCTIPEDEDSEEITLQVKNLAASPISKFTLVHKFNGLRPNVRDHNLANLAPNATASIAVSTKTGFSAMFESDWWMLAWAEEADPCIVYTTISPSLVAQVQQTWQELKDAFENEDLSEISVSGEAFQTLAAEGMFAGIAAGTDAYLKSYVGSASVGAFRDFVQLAAGGKSPEGNAATEVTKELLGPAFWQIVMNKAKKTTGFNLCDLKSEDLHHDISAQLAIGDSSMTVKWTFASDANNYFKSKMRCSMPVIRLRAEWRSECSIS